MTLLMLPHCTACKAYEKCGGNARASVAKESMLSIACLSCMPHIPGPAHRNSDRLLLKEARPACTQLIPMSL